MNDIHDDDLSRLYQKSRIEEPPMGLDSAILTQARKAVEKKKNLWCKVRWMVPLTSFALAMLTATLFIQMKQEHPEILEPSSIAPISPSSTLQTEETMKDDIQRNLKKREVAADKEQTEKRDRAGTPAPAMELKSAPAEIEMAPAKTLMKQPKKLKREALGASQFRSREKISEVDSAAPSQPELLKEDISLDPEVWIAKIRQLVEQEKRDEAIKELNAFRATYPDYILPDDLKLL